MKKKKILNIRKGLVAGALILTTTIAGLGIHNFVNKQTEEPTKSNKPNSSQTIIDNKENNVGDVKLPGGIIIETPAPEITEQPVIEEPVVTTTPEVNKVEQEQKPNKENEQKPSSGNNNNQGNNEGNNETINPVESTDPAIDEIEHEHTLGKWVAIDDKYEGNYCPEDGKLVSKRLHRYILVSKDVISNNDGTHNIYITGKCTSCGHTKTRVIENLECNYNEITWDSVFEYETCNDCDYTHTVGKHELDEGTINGTQITYSCENDGCEYSYTKPYNPNQNNNNNNNNHNNGNNNNGNNNGGSGNTEKPDHTHYFGEWVSINDDLEGNYCPEDGKLMGTRAHKYGQKDSKVIPNNNGTHTLVESETCSNCNHEKTTTINEACKFGPEVLVGNQYVSTCETCGYEKTRPYTPPEHNHNWSEWQITKQPTCTETGEETRTCTIDGCTIKVETRVIPALGHTYGEWIVSEDWHVVTKEDGTQVEQRTLEQTCGTCGDKKTKTEEKAYTPEHVHNWSEWQITKPATCTEDGEETRTCSVDGCTIKVETRVIPALNHSYKESTSLVSNGDGTHDLIKTKTCGACGDVQTETISSGISCSYDNISEITNDAGQVIQEIHSCDCGQSYTVDIDPQPDHTTHTPDSNGQYRRKGTDCCYETYYICGECGEEYGNSSVGHIEGEPDEFGIIQCEECGKVLGKKQPDTPTIPIIPTIETTNEDEELAAIIEEQDQAFADANATADQELNDLINSDMTDSEKDIALDQIIDEQDKSKQAAQEKADQDLNEIIVNIEDAKINQIILNQDLAVAEARRNAEAKLEAVLSSDISSEAKDAKVDTIIEEADRTIGLAIAKADAELAALVGVSPSANAVRLLTK